jgi:mannonate dehydratase
LVNIALDCPSTFTDEDLLFGKQLGVEYVVVAGHDLGGPGYWEYVDLLRMKRRIEAQGLQLVAIENVPLKFWDQVLMGAPGRDEQIANYCKLVRNVGEAGIPILGYHFSPVIDDLVNVWGHWRVGKSGGGRGGAGLTSFDYDLVKHCEDAPGDQPSAEEVWDRILYFLQRVVPVAEDAGVKLAAHPNDPPANVLRGATRVLNSVDGLKRLLDIYPSEASGLDFCQGTITETGADVLEAIRYFGSRGKIFYGHLRNVRNLPGMKPGYPKYDETFIDDGDVDIFKALKAYKEAGFTGVLRPDHVPTIAGDSQWGHRSRAFAIGYIRALMKVVNES